VKAACLFCRANPFDLLAAIRQQSLTKHTLGSLLITNPPSHQAMAPMIPLTFDPINPSTSKQDKTLTTDTEAFFPNLRQSSILTLIFAGIYWIWAIYNTKKTDDGLYNYEGFTHLRDTDLGVYSFFTVMITCCLMINRSSHPQFTIPHWLSRSHLFSHLLVTLNYFAAFLGSLSMGLDYEVIGLVYVGGFTILWVGLGRWNYMLAVARSEVEGKVEGEDCDRTTENSES
jgi:hypothetical protein